ncbi:MAG: 2Fe-2S iron-sulfur cluster-binding protein [Myxococcales bacterium]|jgi:ferredoxin
MIPRVACRVRLEPSGVELRVPPGERVLDVLDERALETRRPSPLPVRCRAANCATCLVRVRAGAEALLPADDREREVLDLIQAGEDQRLGCQLVIDKDTQGASLILAVVAPVA